MDWDWAVWGTPLAVFFGAIMLGVLAAVSARETADPSVQRDGKNKDLDRNRAAALQALKDLELDRDKLAPEDYQRERTALLARGGAAARALDVEPGDPTPDRQDEITQLATYLREARSRIDDDGIRRALTLAGVESQVPSGAPVMSPAWRGAATVMILMAIAGGLFYNADTGSVARRDGASMTGNQDLGGGSQATSPPWMAMAQDLEAKLAADPTNLDIANELTQLYMSAGDPGKAMEYNRKAFEITDKDPTARTYKAVLAAMVGMTDRAIAGLEEVLEDTPGHVKALTYLGLILLEANRTDEAIDLLEQAVALQPGVMPLQQALNRARQRAGRAPVAPPPTPSPSGPAEVVLSGTLTLDASAEITGSEILFVSVRAPGGGPPLAALRLPPGPFPMDFEITTANAIAMGGAPRPFPDALMLSVRIDRDGDPISKAPDEPSATVPNATKGSTDLKLTLR
jgi:cytochrome c-type biogenesis protein CcmH